LPRVGQPPRQSVDSVKSEFISVRSLRDWTNVLEKWYHHDAPGVWPDPKAADEVNQAPAEACAID
jgi:hypothetical protein